MDMDGAHGHVCHAEGGHGDGIHIAFMIASTQHTECDIFLVLVLVLVDIETLWESITS